MEENLKIPNTNITAFVSENANNALVAWAPGGVDMQIEAASYMADRHNRNVIAEFNGSQFTVCPGIYNDENAKKYAVERLQNVYQRNQQDVTLDLSGLSDSLQR